MSKFQVIGTLCVPDVLGRRRFQEYLDTAMQDLLSLQDGGIDLVLIENQGNKARSRKALPSTVELMTRVLEDFQEKINVPYLVAALPADYENSFGLARRFNAAGVWMDTLVDRVSPIYTDRKIVIDIEPGDVLEYKGDKRLFAEVQARNFYRMLGKKPLEQSIREARKFADAICIVGKGGPPSLDQVKQARRIVGDSYPLVVAGKINQDNIAPYKSIAEYCVVFSSIRQDGDYRKPIDKAKVRNLMQAVKG